MTDVSTRIPEARRLALIWTGALLPPIAALLDLDLSYMLVTQACLQQNLLPLHLVHLAGLVLTITGGLIAWHVWREAGRTWPVDEPGALGSTRFMAAIGVLGSVAFTLVALALWVPVWVLSPCQ
jgi:hypothetical protein